MSTETVVVIAVAVAGAAALLWFRIARRGHSNRMESSQRLEPHAPPPLVIHPDDSWMVTQEDMDWFSTLSNVELGALLEQDNQFRFANWRGLVERGMTEEEAAARVRKAFPSYYVLDSQREDKFRQGEDAHLPACVKGRLHGASAVLGRDEFESAPEATMNAIIRRLLREGRLE